MIGYTMPVLSEQEREKAIAACKDEIGHLKQMVAAAKSGGRYSATGYQSQLIRQQIALAALTAEPIGDMLWQGRDLYLAPPVPVIKQEAKTEGEQ